MTKGPELGGLVAGAGACELELARHIREYGETVSGQDQYAVTKFADALEIIPRTLADNTGKNATEILTNMYAEHANGNVTVGISEEGELLSADELNIYDHGHTKMRAFNLATNCALTILKYKLLPQLTLGSVKLLWLSVVKDHSLLANKVQALWVVMILLLSKILIIKRRISNTQSHTLPITNSTHEPTTRYTMPRNR